MRGKRAKEIRQFVRSKFAFMSPVPVYQQDIHGAVRLQQTCQRAFIQNIKDNYKRKK